MKSLLIDFHGVLTDGRQSITHDGEYLFDHCHSRDVRSIRELVARGWYVAIVTTSSSPIVRAFADKVGAELIVARDKAKVIAVGEYYAIGDDAWDIKMLKLAKQAYCPADADRKVREIPGIVVLQAKGGNGVIAEFIHLAVAYE